MQTLQAHADGRLRTVSATATAAAPARLSIFSGRGQTGGRGAALPVPLITVSADPPRLHVVQGASGAVTHLNLDATPNAVTVQPDGAYAAVGHNAFISYVNLTTMTVERVYASHSAELQKLLVVRGPNFGTPTPSELQAYNDVFLTLRGAVALPSYVETGPSGATAYVSEGRFVFVHRAGARVYVLVRGRAPYEGRFNTGLVVFEMADIP